MSATDAIMPEDDDIEASKQLIKSSNGQKGALIKPASAAEGKKTAAGGQRSAVGGQTTAAEDLTCSIIDAKPPESIKHLIPKDDATISK